MLITYIHRLHYFYNVTSSRANITACIYHFTNIPLGYCHKDNDLEPEFQHNIRQKHVFRLYIDRLTETWQLGDIN